MITVSTMYSLGTCQKLSSRSEFTPDFPKLRHYDHVLVFNYSKDFKPGKEFTNLLYPRESAYLGRAYTAMDNYVVKEIQDTDVRVAFKNNLTPPLKFSPLFKSHIKGELYALTPEALLNMDRVLGNTKKFQRERKFVVPREQSPVFKHSTRTTIEVWMYLGIEEYWEQKPLVKSSVMNDYGVNLWMWN